ELHHEHPDVLGHSHDHLAEALGLRVFAGREVDLAELGHPVDQRRDLLTEFRLNLGQGYVCVFDNVVQKAGADAGSVQLQSSNERSDTRRMGKVGLTAFAKLIPMSPFAKTV